MKTIESYYSGCTARRGALSLFSLFLTRAVPMADDALTPGLSDAAVQVIASELVKANSSKRRRIGGKFFLAALSAIPWVGAFISAAASIPKDEADARNDDLRTQWLGEHQRKLNELHETLRKINERFESLGPEIEERIESPEYLSLVRQAFRTWDQAETEEKRQFVANLVSNSAGTRVTSDDVIRLFVGWLAEFHEAHFAVIHEIHQNPGSTRYDIWSGIHADSELPREDSAEADLYRMLIRDLSTSGVIRQVRDTNEAGQFLRKRAPKRRRSAPSTMKSSFDDNEQYVLTELGKQFVHYTLLGEIRRLETKHG